MHIKYLEQLTDCTVISTVTKEEDEKGWNKARTKGIGGSDIGPICGISPFTTARQIYLVKTGQYKESFNDSLDEHGPSERMHFGNVLESVVADEFTRRQGLKVIQMPVVLASKKLSYAVANVDRFVIDADDNITAILECKTAGEYSKGDWEDGNVMLTYIYQVNWYMYVTGIKKAYIACIVGGNKFFCHEVLYNEKLVKDMLEKAKFFWEENVKKLIEPIVTNIDNEFLNKQYQKADLNDSEEFEEGSVFEQLATTIVDCKAKIKEFESICKDAEARIKDLLKESEFGLSPNYVIRWQPIKQYRIDADAVKLKYPEIYSNVLKEIQYRRLSVKNI